MYSTWTIPFSFRFAGVFCLSATANCISSCVR